jgi:hypothetical protein
MKYQLELNYAKQSQFMPFLAQKWTFVEKTKPIQSQTNPIQTQNKAKQTQFKPNFTRHSVWRANSIEFRAFSAAKNTLGCNSRKIDYNHKAVNVWQGLKNGLKIMEV